MDRPAQMTRREKYKTKHTLICLLQAVVGRITTVELRNECCATGYIESVDGFMNVMMSRVLFVVQDGQKTHMESFFVQGALVRYVQIPDDIDMARAMKRELGALNAQGRPAAGSMSAPRKKPPLPPLKK